MRSIKHLGAARVEAIERRVLLSAGTASISGVMYDDLNRNGARDAAIESPLVGWGCFIDANGNGVFDAGSDLRVTSDANGAYKFSNLGAGTYRISQMLPSGWSRVSPAVTFSVTVGNGQAVTGKNIGNVRSAAGAAVDSNGMLVVTGSNGVDTILVNRKINDQPSDGTIDVTVNGQKQTFAALGLTSVYVDARGGNDSVQDEGGDFSLESSGLPTTILGGDGNDSIIESANAGNHMGLPTVVYGGAGDDTITTQTDGDVTLHGGDGNDVFDNRPGSSNHAVIFGDAGNDTIHFDVLDSSMDIHGGAGIDTVDNGPNLVGNSGTITLDDVANDKFDLEGIIQNVHSDVENLNLHGNGGDLSVVGSSAANTFTLSGWDHVTIKGQAGNDTISVTAGVAASLYGGDGNDSLKGGDEPDFFSGGNGVDVVDYSARTENLTIGIGTVADDGAAGEHDNVFNDVERVYGGSGNDSITGSAGDNALFGNGGNDTLTGGGGVDALFGGDGNDTLRAKDGVKDFVDGGAGIDNANTDLIDTGQNVETVAN